MQGQFHHDTLGLSRGPRCTASFRSASGLPGLLQMHLTKAAASGPGCMRLSVCRAPAAPHGLTQPSSLSTSAHACAALAAAGPGRRHAVGRRARAARGASRRQPARFLHCCAVYRCHRHRCAACLACPGPDLLPCTVPHPGSAQARAYSVQAAAAVQLTLKVWRAVALSPTLVYILYVLFKFLIFFKCAGTGRPCSSAAASVKVI